MLAFFSVEVDAIAAALDQSGSLTVDIGCCVGQVLVSSHGGLLVLLVFRLPCGFEFVVVVVVVVFVAVPVVVVVATKLQDPFECSKGRR